MKKIGFVALSLLLVGASFARPIVNVEGRAKQTTRRGGMAIHVNRLRRVLTWT